MNKEGLLNIAAKFCDRCGTAYETNDLEIIKNSKTNVLLMLKCHNCGAVHMVNIAVNKGVGTRFMLNTDLSSDEMKIIPIGQAVTSNEIIDIHEILESKGNSIKDLAVLYGFDFKGFIKKNGTKVTNTKKKHSQTI